MAPYIVIWVPSHVRSLSARYVYIFHFWKKKCISSQVPDAARHLPPCRRQEIRFGPVSNPSFPACLGRETSANGESRRQQAPTGRTALWDWVTRDTHVMCNDNRHGVKHVQCQLRSVGKLWDTVWGTMPRLAPFCVSHHIDIISGRIVYISSSCNAGCDQINRDKAPR